MPEENCHVGDRIGPFVLEQRLSDEGAVYHAIHVEQRRSVALKVLPPLAVRDERAVQGFARELLFLQTLQHPNVVPCYGGGVHELQPYLVMELVRGESLRRRLQRGGPLSWEDACGIAKAVCEALSYADHRNVQHLRLSPDKILLAESGWTKVADFRRPRGPIGVAAPEAARTIESLTYQAPEQIVGKPPASHKSDLYALGCIFFEMLTGRPPFVAYAAEAVAQQHLTADAPRVSEGVIDCPVWLEALVTQLLEKDPRRRPEFASGVSVALEEAAERVRSGASMAQHALSVGPSAIRPQQADSEARQLFAKKKKPPPPKPFYEKLWFLLTCLALLVAVVTWSVWPLSEQELFERGRALMLSEDRDQWRIARRDYLDPLLSRHPDGPYAEEAQAFVDQIEMAEAEERIKRHAWLGRAPTSIGERLYIQARSYEEFGDYATAKTRYVAMLKELEAAPKQRPFCKLAERQIGEIQARKTLPTPAEVLDEKLAEADRLASSGRVADARQIWDIIIMLYRDEPDLKPQVKQAQDRFLGVER